MNKIKEKRQAANMTQAFIAEAMQVDRTAVTKWETGEAMPRADKLPQLAKILNCSIEDLFDDKEVR